MKKALAALGLLLLCAAPAAQASIPNEVLDREYQSCIGNDSDPARAAFCGCVLDGMKSWDDETFTKVAVETSANASTPTAAPPAQLVALAQQCINKVLR